MDYAVISVQLKEKKAVFLSVLRSLNLKDHLGNTRVVFNPLAIPDERVVQHTDYYPFGMSHTPTYTHSTAGHKYLYNGKEQQDDLGLGWYDYGARFYDAQIGRWHSVDPLAEKYYATSPYAYVGNNPIVRHDPDGREWVDEKDGKAATRVIKKIERKERRLERKQSQLDRRAERAENSGRTARSESLSKKSDDIGSRREVLTASANEIREMGTDKNNFFTFNQTTTGENFISSQTMNFKGNWRNVTVINSNGSSVMKIHELKHAYQLMKGIGSIIPNSKNILFNSVELATNFEIDAYSAQYAYDPSSMPNSSYAGPLRYIYQVNVPYVAGIKDNGAYIYPAARQHFGNLLQILHTLNFFSL